jgi:hypothetical protein
MTRSSRHIDCTGCADACHLPREQRVIPRAQPRTTGRLAAMRNLMIVASALMCACASAPPPRSAAQRAADTAPALAALRDAHFELAVTDATAALALDPKDADAAAIRAIATYVTAADELWTTLEELSRDADRIRAFDHPKGRAAWTTFLDRLRAVDADLAIAAADDRFALELCPACWQRDWNHNGRIDSGDEHLLEVEVDAAGQPLPDGDPRRRPTFRFDVGDLDWARSMIAFQRAAVEVVLAYRWTALDQLVAAADPHELRISLVAPERVKLARAYLLDGIGFAVRCRREYLAETDDDREWVPNPHQHSHGVPLGVDDALYDRWQAILEDVRRLVAGEDGVSIREVAGLLDEGMAPRVPDAYVDVGKMFDEPADIVVRFDKDLDQPAGIERALRGLLGHGYAEQMRPSPLVGRIASAIHELDRGEDTVGHKLRSLFWLN